MDTNSIIDALGGTSEVAKLCDVTTGAVSQWRQDGIPKARLMYLQAIRPEVFGINGRKKERRKASRRATDKRTS